MLQPIDFFFIAIYFIILLVIGYFSARKEKADGYLIADRKLGIFSTLMTLNASKTGSILMLFTALTYQYGFSAIWYFIGMIVASVLFIPFATMLKKKSKKKYYTLADYYKYNFGKKAAKIVSIATIIVMFGSLVINMIAITKLFVFFTSWPFWLCALIIIVVITAYIVMAGFKAVAKTDILQYIAMISIMVLITIMIFNGKTIPASEWNIAQANIGAILGFFILGIMYAFGSPDLWQRVYAAKDEKTVKWGYTWSVILYAVMAGLLALVAMTVKVLFPNIDSDTALVYGFANLLPQGILGLGVVLLFAAIMSSIDTYIFTGASAIIQDFFVWSKKKWIKGVRIAAIIFAILAIILATIIQDLVFGSYIYVAVVVVISIGVLATWIRPKMKEKTLVYELITGLIATFIGVVLLQVYNVPMEMIMPVALVASLVGMAIGATIVKIQKN